MVSIHFHVFIIHYIPDSYLDYSGIEYYVAERGKNTCSKEDEREAEVPLKTGTSHCTGFNTTVTKELIFSANNPVTKQLSSTISTVLSNLPFQLWALMTPWQRSGKAPLLLWQLRLIITADTQCKAGGHLGEASPLSAQVEIWVGDFLCSGWSLVLAVLEI